MAADSQYLDSARMRNPEQNPKVKGTPGTGPWKAAVLNDLREGYGVEDIALRLDCRVHSVRNFVSDMRRAGILPEIYADARKAWQSVGSLAARLVAKAEGKP